MKIEAIKISKYGYLVGIGFMIFDFFLESHVVCNVCIEKGVQHLRTDEKKSARITIEFFTMHRSSDATLFSCILSTIMQSTHEDSCKFKFYTTVRSIIFL